MAPQTSGKADKKCDKAHKNISITDKKKKKRNRVLNHAIYIYTVLKQILPEPGITSKTMTYREFMRKRQIRAYRRRLAFYNKRPTITSRELQPPVRLLLSDELAKYIVSEGHKVLTKYTFDPSKACSLVVLY